MKGFILGFITFLVLNLIFNGFGDSDLIAEHEREDADLDSLSKLVFTLEKINGKFPTEDEVNDLLSSDDMGKDRFGNPYQIERELTAT